MKPAYLNNDPEVISDGMDSVVIRQHIASIKGGRTLDMTNYAGGEVIKAGHVVIYDTVNKEYKPMPLNEAGTGYGSLPANHEYAGVVIATQPAKRPLVGIMYAGEVNDIACPYSVDSIKSAMKTALPNLVFMHD